MRNERQVTAEESGSKVPAYIVTYSDMVTLLLTFFVMLMSLSSMQDPELFYQGRGSFIQSVRELGLGVLYGKEMRPDLGHVKIRYFIETPDKLATATRDAKEEEIRRLFNRVNQSMTTMPSPIAAKRADFAVSNIRFAPGQATLNESAKRFLAEFCVHLQARYEAGSEPGASPKVGVLYVLGLADDQPTEKQQWLLSARRAQAVADFLQDTLQKLETSVAGWRVYWWGAGPGGDWVTQDSPISKRSQILIAVLKASD